MLCGGLVKFYCPFCSPLSVSYTPCTDFCWGKARWSLTPLNKIPRDCSLIISAKSSFYSINWHDKNMYRKLHYAIWCGHHIHVPQQGIWNLIFIFVVMRGQQDVWVDEAVKLCYSERKTCGSSFLFYYNSTT